VALQNRGEQAVARDDNRPALKHHHARKIKQESNRTKLSKLYVVYGSFASAFHKDHDWWIALPFGSP
jgi:hypothetical protein